MKLRLLISVGFLSFLFINTQATQAKTEGNQEAEVKQDSTSHISKSFTLKELIRERKESGKAFVNFINNATMQMYVYSLPAGGVDKQTPHKLDEVYYVTEGIAELRVEDKNYKVSPGSIVYVKAKAEHKFHAIKKDLTVIVFFSTTDPAK